MALTPEELRFKTEDAKAAQRRERLAEEKAKAITERAARDAIMERVPDWIKAIEFNMKGAAENGNDRVRYKLATTGPYEGDYERFKEPAAAVVDHFTRQGFNAAYRVDHTTDWYRGEPGPGPAHHYIEVGW